MNIAKLKEIFENCCYENNNEKIYYGINLDENNNILVFYENLKRSPRVGEVKKILEFFSNELNNALNSEIDYENKNILGLALQNINEVKTNMIVKLDNEEYGNLYLNVFDVPEKFYDIFDKNYREMLSKNSFEIKEVAEVAKSTLNECSYFNTYHVEPVENRSLRIRKEGDNLINLYIDFDDYNEYEIFSELNVKNINKNKFNMIKALSCRAFLFIKLLTKYTFYAIL